MILRMPEYCREFSCTADKCSDSCCIGWEIDIDEKTADYYMTLEGDFGDRLRKGIVKNDSISFILKNERCPFLNDRNLCDIILRLGEERLCHICAEHPRYYEWFDGVKEGGVGLCCEAAAELILLKGEEAAYYEKEVADEENDSYDDELYAFLYKAREAAMAYLRDTGRPLKNTVSALMHYSQILQECIDNGEIAEVPEIADYAFSGGRCNADAIFEVFLSLEPIDEKWRPYVKELSAKKKYVCPTDVQEKYIRNIGIYFIWRYFMKGVFDEEILSKVKLAVISMVMTGLMFCSEHTEDLKSCARLAKNYSKEIEYSEENMESIYDMTYAEQVFSEENLAAFFG